MCQLLTSGPCRACFMGASESMTCFPSTSSLVDRLCEVPPANQFSQVSAPLGTNIFKFQGFRLSHFWFRNLQNALWNSCDEMSMKSSIYLRSTSLLFCVENIVFDYIRRQIWRSDQSICFYFTTPKSVPFTFFHVLHENSAHSSNRNFPFTGFLFKINHLTTE